MFGFTFGHSTLISLRTLGAHSHKREHTSIKNFHNVRGRGFTTIFFLVLVEGTEIVVPEKLITACNDHEAIFPVRILPLALAGATNHATAIKAGTDSNTHTIRRFFIIRIDSL